MNVERRTNSKGFTLIELIISSAIIATIGIAVYSVFSGGIRVWQRAESFRTYQRSPRLGLELLTRDLRNCLDFSEISFQGEEDSISFAGLIESLAEQAEEPVYELGKISYFLNQEFVFCRSQQHYGPAFQGQDEDRYKVRELIPNIAELKFAYLGLNPETEKLEWLDTWPKFPEEPDQELEADKLNQAEELVVQDKDFGLPQAVRIELELEGENFEPEKFTKTIILPLARSVEINRKE